MKLIVFGLALVSASAFAGPMIGLNIPKPGAIGQGACLAKASVLNYGYVGIQTSLPSDPSKISTAALQTAVTTALLNGQEVLIRQSHRVDPSWSKWGATFKTPMYPPASTWPKIAACQLANRNAAIAAATAVANQKGWSLSKLLATIHWELGDEKGIGGVGGDCLGSWSSVSKYYVAYQTAWKNKQYATAKKNFLLAFPPELWVADGTTYGHAQPEGYIPPSCWKMLRYLRFAVDYQGMTTNALTFEMGGSFDSKTGKWSGPGTIEVASATGADAIALFGGCSRQGFNYYENDAHNYYDPIKKRTREATPMEAANRWAAGVPTRLAVMAANPILPKVYWVTETNIRPKNCPTDLGYSVPDYRNAQLRVAAGITTLEAIGVYCALAQDNASTDTNDWTFDAATNKLFPVGGVDVGPSMAIPLAA